MAALAAVRCVSRVYVIVSRKTMEEKSVAGMNGLCNILTDCHSSHIAQMSLLQEKQVALDPPYKKQKVKHDEKTGIEHDHPAETLRKKATSWSTDVTSREFAKKMDVEDPLHHLRDRFHYPKSIDLPEVDSSLVSEDEECVYFCGNSLGLMPKSAPDCINRELDKWAKTGVAGHFVGYMPWATCDEVIQPLMASIVGAKTEEVGLMNGLTVNLHLLVISFYEPTPTRHKILLESKAFPSDHYAIESQIRLKGYDPKTSMICMEPREGEVTLRHDDVISFLEKEGDSIALVLLPSVQYYTGQLFDMKAITQVAQRKGCLVGFDLAHAVGNVPVHLHDWGVDFACWCTYKYLCSGAGGIAGAFIHEKHAHSKRFRLTGWWSHKMDTRFNMDNVMDLSPGIAGYRISNPPPLLCAPLEASLKVYNQTTMEDLRAKSILLTAYLELLLKHYYPKPTQQNTENSNDQNVDRVTDQDTPHVELITPTDPTQRGCQLSAMFSVPVTEVFQALQKRGVVLDHRKPNVLRLAPVHLYNSFLDVYRFVMMLGDAMREAKRNLQNNSDVTDN